MDPLGLGQAECGLQAQHVEHKCLSPHQTSLNNTDETPSAVPGLMLTLMLMNANYLELLTSLDWCKLSY